MTQRRFWTDEEDRAVVADALARGSALALAQKLDRTVSSVYARRQVLVSRSKPKTEARNPVIMPKGHGGRLVAKTCRHCGELLLASAFPISGTRRRSYCQTCIAVRSAARRADDTKAWDESAPRLLQVRKQATAVAGARMARMEWTGPELETVMRPDLTDEQKCEMLGRSFYAVRKIIRKINAGDPIKTRLLGASRA